MGQNIDIIAIYRSRFSLSGLHQTACIVQIAMYIPVALRL